MRAVQKYIVPISFLLFFMTGCETDSESIAPLLDEDTGHLVMYLTDAPTDDVSEVNIVVGRVEVHSDETGWTVIRNESETFDLLALKNGETVVLSDTVLQAGTYTQIRLYIEEGSNVVVDGQSHELIIPSGFETGVKLVGQFTVTGNERIDALLDFDVHQSLVHAGTEYQLKPVIRFQVLNVTGDISGQVEPVEANALIVVSQQGEIVTTTYADEINGTFKIIALNPGQYNVLVISREDESVFVELPDVVVEVDQTTDLGTISIDENG
jgi:hypothetical protein